MVRPHFTSGRPCCESPGAVVRGTLKQPGRRIGQRGDATRAPTQVQDRGWRQDAASRHSRAWPKCDKSIHSSYIIRCDAARCRSPPALVHRQLGWLPHRFHLLRLDDLDSPTATTSSPTPVPSAHARVPSNRKLRPSATQAGSLRGPNPSADPSAKSGEGGRTPPVGIPGLGRNAINPFTVLT
jgi:hypothetical protein